MNERLLEKAIKENLSVLLDELKMADKQPFLTLFR